MNLTERGQAIADVAALLFCLLALTALAWVILG